MTDENQDFASAQGPSRSSFLSLIMALQYDIHCRLCRAIKSNQDLRPDVPWTHVFFDDFWGTPLAHSGSHKSFRPLCTLSFRLNYALGGLEPWGYHLVNVGLHAACSTAYTRLTGKLLPGKAWSFLAGLLFAVHPIHTEAVAGVVGRADVGAGLFFLLSLLSYARYCQSRDGGLAMDVADCGQGRGKRWAWLSGSLVCAAASMLWKEQGVTVLMVAAVYDIFVHSGLTIADLLLLLCKPSYGGLREGLAFLSICSAVLVSFRLKWMGSVPPSFSASDNPGADAPELLTRTLTFHYLPAANLGLLLWPGPLSFDWSMDAIPLLRSPTDLRNACTLALYGCLGLFTHYVLLGLKLRWAMQRAMHFVNNKRKANGYNCSDQKDGYSNGFTVAHLALPSQTKDHSGICCSELDATIMALALLILPFLPASNLLFYVGFVLAERILYIPSMGFCLLVATGARALHRAAAHRSLARVALWAASVSLILALTVRTALRNNDWRDEEALYRSGLAVNPAKAWGNLGNVLKGQGKVREAEVAYRNALYFRGNMADMLYNLGLLLQEDNRPDEALRYYQLAITSRPTLASAYLNTGIILTSQGKTEEAKTVFRTCANISDERLKDPQAHMTSVTSCLYNLGKVLHEKEHHQEAIFTFIEAVKKMPRQFAPQSLYNMMGEAHLRLNNLREAEYWYKESIKSKPDHIPVHLTYAKLLAMTNRREEAENLFHRAITLDPRKGNSYMHYAQFLAEQNRFVEAASIAEKAAEKDSQDFEIIFSTAHMCRQAGMNQAAEVHYRRASNLQPNQPTALMNLGAILHLNGRLHEAEAYYLQALQLKPNDAITQSNLQKLHKIIERHEVKGHH
uniref:protein O-mannosyl-transferase TMTC2 isoform X2 n=1 Tax=Myxine glutinosa TaxID=7769 RepID=UPI00358F6F31